MLELVVYVWLLGATAIFVGVAMSGASSDRSEPLWLLALAASWPLVAFVFLIGTTVTLAGRLFARGDETWR